MTHVRSLPRLHKPVEAPGARHVVTLLKDIDLVRRPDVIIPNNHLILGVDDITEPLDGYVAPADEHLTRLIEFVRGWDRTKPLVVHCYAGISRSTAGAFVTVCALNPQRSELAIAQALRQASAPRGPHPRFAGPGPPARGGAGPQGPRGPSPPAAAPPRSKVIRFGSTSTRPAVAGGSPPHPM